MLYIFTALYSEAHIFIDQYHLQKNPQDTRFQQFQNETAGILLTVTGVGEIAAAAAVSSICTERRPGERDVLLNVGTCAHPSENGGIFLCNKIIEQATGKTFYPDILYRHSFREKSIVTEMRTWNIDEDAMTENSNRSNQIDSAGMSTGTSCGHLYDMESAAIYQAGSYFFGPHQMIFLKVVSDRGAPRTVSREQIEQIMKSCQDDLFQFIEMILTRTMQETGPTGDYFPQEKEAFIGKLCMDLHCSQVMSDSLRQHIRYLTLAGSDYVSVIQDMYREGLLPCKDKREGKLRFEEFKRRLF